VLLLFPRYTVPPDHGREKNATGKVEMMAGLFSLYPDETARIQNPIGYSGVHVVRNA